MEARDLNRRLSLIPVSAQTLLMFIINVLQDLQKELVDESVIAGHVVPGELLFTNPLSRDEEKTATYTDDSSIKVSASLQSTSSGCESEMGLIRLDFNQYEIVFQSKSNRLLFKEIGITDGSTFLPMSYEQISRFPTESSTS